MGTQTAHYILLAVQRQVQGLVGKKAALQTQIDGLVAERDALRSENERLRELLRRLHDRIGRMLADPGELNHTGQLIMMATEMESALGR